MNLAIIFSLVLMFSAHLHAQVIPDGSYLSCELTAGINIYKKTPRKLVFVKNTTRYIQMPSEIELKTDYSDDFSQGWFTRGYSANDKTLDIRIKLEGEMDSAIATMTARYLDKNVSSELYVKTSEVVPSQGFTVELIQTLPEPENTYGKFHSEVERISLNCKAL